jgi:protein SCO1/2
MDSAPVPDSVARSPFSVKRFWIALCVLLLVGIAIFAFRPHPSSNARLPVLGQVSDFLMTEREGKPITLDSLAGRIWIADFIFTSCAGSCPVMTARMRKLSDELAKRRLQDVMLVSFSVDPTRDTPRALREYADKYGAPAGKWLFLTGDQAEIDRLAVKSFKIGHENPVQEEILHSERFFLVDSKGQVRGTYGAMSEAESENLTAIAAEQAMPKAEQDRLFANIATLELQH